MTAPFYLELPEPPSANRWWRKFRNQMVLSDEARDYIEEVRAIAQQRGVRAVPGLVDVTIRWFRRRRAGDTDKRVGILLDALQGVAYDNDSAVADLHAHRREDPENPRVEVEVRPSTYEPPPPKRKRPRAR